MVEVDLDYVKDAFNLHGFEQYFGKEKFKKCIKIISSDKAPSEEDLSDEQFLEINQEASDLYGLLHARYINTATGMAKI